MNRLLLIALLILAIILTANGTVLAQAQPQLVSLHYEGALPVSDPLAPAWETAPVLEVVLIAQAVTTPRLITQTIPSVQVRSLNDGKQIAFRLTWPDATANWFASHLDEFRDAAAIQLAMTPTAPSFCMGATGQLVNLWHWKADWQYDIDQGFRDVVDAYPNFWLDYYPQVSGKPPYRLPTDFNTAPAKAYLAGWSAGNPLSNPMRVTPIEDVNAVGFGSLTSQASQNQNVLGRGVWKDGRWYVVLARTLQSTESNDAQLIPGQTTSIALAVWDGAEKQVGARKQLSTWVPLLIERPQQSGIVALGTVATIVGGLLVVVVALTFLLVEKGWLK